MKLTHKQQENKHKPNRPRVRLDATNQQIKGEAHTTSDL